jgi:hypothetical protein
MCDYVINHKAINIIRDIATSLENLNLNASYEFMQICKQHRPSGALIESKLLSYASLLRIPKNVAQDTAALDISSLSNIAIDRLRDKAIEIEKTDVSTALELMSLARISRPHGPTIAKRCKIYSEKQERLREAILSSVKNEQVAIVPVGFRCHTKASIKRMLGLAQAGLPFDTGFFSPHSIISMIMNPVIALDAQDVKTYSLCIKDDPYKDESDVKAIRFTRECKQNIDLNVEHCLKTNQSLHRYIDSTMAYYTIDETHYHVLAHYNWHSLSVRPSNMKDNLYSINQTLNRRLARLFHLIQSANTILLVWAQHGYSYMQLDGSRYDLSDTTKLVDCFMSQFPGKRFNFVSSNDLTLERASQLLFE